MCRSWDGVRGVGADFGAGGAMCARYPTDLTDAQWARVQAALPPAVHGRTGRPRRHALRDVWDRLFYVTRTGCSWRALPNDFPG